MGGWLVGVLRAVDQFFFCGSLWVSDVVCG